jgi:hypothetical protein
VRSASEAARERATNEPGHAVSRWMIAGSLGPVGSGRWAILSAALPVATAFLGSEQPWSLVR